MSNKKATSDNSPNLLAEPTKKKDGNPVSVNLSGLPDPIYLEKDAKQEYPLQKHDLDNVIVYQYTKEKIRNREYDVPADHVSPIQMYTPEEFDQHIQEGGLFDRLGLLYDVWHQPGEETDETTEPDKDQTPAA